MSVLRDDDIETRLREISGWGRANDEIEKEYRFDGFASSMAFVNKIAALAEAADHHPDIAIKYNRVMLTLSTHSEGGLTDKDFALAREIDTIA